MSPMSNIECGATDVVACLSCGSTRIATRTRATITPTACPACGYPGWRPARGADRRAAGGGALVAALQRLAAHPS